MTGKKYPGWMSDEILIEMSIANLKRVTMQLASWDKRFFRDVLSKDREKLTYKQKIQIFRPVHKYRRQIPNKMLVKYSEQYKDHPSIKCGCDVCKAVT